MNNENQKQDEEPPFVWTGEAEKFLLAIRDERHPNLFLTGGAGVGKTSLMKEAVRILRDEEHRQVAYTATTGLAARVHPELLGTTIHEWSGMQTGERSVEDIVRSIRSFKTRPDSAHTRIRQTDVLIIDEISMMDPVFLEKLHLVCRKIRGLNHNSQFAMNANHDKPFGGLQVIFCGDLHQLPFVDKSNAMSNEIQEAAFLRCQIFGILEDSIRQLDSITLQIVTSYWTNAESDNKVLAKRYLFKTPTWFALRIRTFMLTVQHRQEGDLVFANHLNNARKGIVTRNDKEFWKSRDLTLRWDQARSRYVRNPDFSLQNIFQDSKGFVLPTLHAKKVDVDQDNRLKLARSNPHPEHELKCDKRYISMGARQPIESNPDARKGIQQILRDMQAPECLILKVGAPVLLVWNIDVHGGLVNGSRGKVIEIQEHTVQVAFESGITMNVARHEYKRSLDPEEMHLPPNQWTRYCAVWQFPLILAYSLTIHKTQGQTLTAAVVNLADTHRTPGQAYVAVSRLKSADQLYLANFESPTLTSAGSFLADPQVGWFYNELETKRT